jgi:hypothetical protein
MDGAGTQPHIHNTTVQFRVGYYGTDKVFFRVFYKRHAKLPINSCLQDPDSESMLRGDLLIMKLAADGNKVVNMTVGDIVLADLAAGL